LVVGVVCLQQLGRSRSHLAQRGHLVRLAVDLPREVVLGEEAEERQAGGGLQGCGGVGEAQALEIPRLRQRRLPKVAGAATEHDVRRPPACVLERDRPVQPAGACMRGEGGGCRVGDRGADREAGGLVKVKGPN
jgi:hypothetical protein